MKFVFLVFFWFRRTEKMDSVMKGLMGAMPLRQNFWAIEPPYGLTRLRQVSWQVCYVVGELYSKNNSCGIARFPCVSTAFLFRRGYTPI